MASDECWYHDEEQENYQRQNHKEVGIQADKRVHKEKRQSMGWLPPAQQTFNPILKQKHHADSIAVSHIVRLLNDMSRRSPGIKSAEVVRH